MVSTPRKNISQLGLLFPTYGKHVPNHQPVLICCVNYNRYVLKVSVWHQGPSSLRHRRSSTGGWSSPPRRWTQTAMMEWHLVWRPKSMCTWDYPSLLWNRYGIDMEYGITHSIPIKIQSRIIKTNQVWKDLTRSMPFCLSTSGSVALAATCAGEATHKCCRHMPLGRGSAFHKVLGEMSTLD